MNRQDRDRYDYGRYDGYNNDEHYHAARNLTDEFEQHYRSERGHDEAESYHPQRSYHEGNEIEETYYRQRRGHDNDRNRSEYRRRDQDTDTNYFGHYNDNQDNYRGNENFYREDRSTYQGHGDRNMSSGLADDYGFANRDNSYGTRERGDQDYRSWNDYRSSRDSDRHREQGAGYTGHHRAGEHHRYSREHTPIKNDRWYDSNERTRYY